MHWVVLLGGGRPCNGQRACGQLHLGGRCSVSGGVVGGEAAVQDTVEAEGREGGAADHAGVVGGSAYGQRSGAMGSVVGGEVVVQRMVGQDAAVRLYFICIWAWARSIGGRRWIPLIIE